MELRQIVELARDGVAAVVVAEDEGVVLHRVADLLDIGEGELGVHRGGQQAGEGFRHNDAGSADRLIRLDVIDEEGGAFFEDGVDHVGVVVAEDHRVRNADEAACQREGPDDARKDGAVGDEFARLPDGVDIQPGAAGAHSGDGEGVRLFLGLADVADDGGDLIVGNARLGAEGFRLDRKVHHADCRAGIHTVGDHLHPLGLEGAVHDQLLDGDAHQLGGGEREDRHRFLDRGGLDVLQPLLHVHENRSFIICLKIIIKSDRD